MKPYFLHGPVRLDFLGHLTGKREFRLVLPVTYVSSDGLRITVDKGFVTDFASVPSWYRWRFDPCGKYGRCAIIHDWLYAAEAIPRDEADAIFLEAMEVDGVPKWDRRVMYRAVRLGGGLTYKAHTDESICEARTVGYIEKSNGEK